MEELLKLLNEDEKKLLKNSLIRAFEKGFSDKNISLNFFSNVIYSNIEKIEVFDFDILRSTLSIVEKIDPEVIPNFLESLQEIKDDKGSFKVCISNGQSEGIEIDFYKLNPGDLPEEVFDSILTRIKDEKDEKIFKISMEFCSVCTVVLLNFVMSKLPEGVESEILKFRVNSERQIMKNFYNNIMNDDGGVYLDLSGGSNLHTKTFIKTFTFSKNLTEKNELLKEILIKKHIKLGNGDIVPLSYATYYSSNSFSEQKVLDFFRKAEEFGIIEKLFDSESIEETSIINIEVIFPEGTINKDSPSNSLINLDTKIFRLKDDSSIMWYYTRNEYGKAFVFTSVDCRNPEKFGKKVTEKDIQLNFNRIMTIKKQVEEINLNKEKYLMESKEE